MSSRRRAGTQLGDANEKIRYTSRVRRGFGMMIERNLRRRVEAIIATERDRPRGEKMTTSEETDFLAAVAWIEQEAESAGGGGDEPATE